ncbi:ubiquinone biosynthesis O-methyltransferase, mitochondrial isoform X2 [Neopsephotus bourkii]|uniref:ubiquinone biosynthesis O-methyltransferase, mitochondrial isoform X2 n=1 Tax=Neopsephotus bourkii TaxID=309878 RepID=UPI002AA56F03|nr:ubiquinone biosynthesis O-methyltransferase, mitochondrial isoform X2 [Neopsephotus bourkii]
MWGGGGAARAFTRTVGRRRAVGENHADLSFQAGLRGALQDCNWKTQPKASSTLPASLSKMKSSIDTLLNLRSNYHLGSPLSGVKILDVGCGGGLLSEPLGRLGASVTGIDPLEDNIRTADQHKSFDPVLAQRIQYKSSSLEEIVEESMETFDVIVASEVVEHVADLEMFIKCCSQVLKPEGSLFITTVNRTQLSYVLGIVVAEKILGIVPEGTHEWEKFVPPEDLERLLESNGFSVKTVNGMFYNPLWGSWSWTESTSINYAMHAVKSGAQGQSSSTNAPSEMESKQHSATAGTAV